MKKIIYILPILFLAAACSKKPVEIKINNTEHATSTEQTSSNDEKWQTYQYLPYNFEFQYPAGFAFTQPVNYNDTMGEPIVQLATSENKYPKTNYVESFFTVTVGNTKTLKECLKPLPNGDPNKDFKETENVKENMFYVAEADGAAAGNIYTSKIYRTWHNNNCVEINLTIHTSQIGNFPPESHIEQVDISKPFEELDQILSTFKFIN